MNVVDLTGSHVQVAGGQGCIPSFVVGSKNDENEQPNPLVAEKEAGSINKTMAVVATPKRCYLAIDQDNGQKPAAQPQKKKKNDVIEIDSNSEAEEEDDDYHYFHAQPFQKKPLRVPMWKAAKTKKAPPKGRTKTSAIAAATKPEPSAAARPKPQKLSAKPAPEIIDLVPTFIIGDGFHRRPVAVSKGNPNARGYTHAEKLQIATAWEPFLKQHKPRLDQEGGLAFWIKDGATIVGKDELLAKGWSDCGTQKFPGQHQVFEGLSFEGVKQRFKKKESPWKINVVKHKDKGIVAIANGQTKGYKLARVVKSKRTTRKLKA